MTMWQSGKYQFQEESTIAVTQLHCLVRLCLIILTYFRFKPDWGEEGGGNKIINKPFGHSKKESESNDILLHFVEFSNVHQRDRRSNVTRSCLAYEIE